MILNTKTPFCYLLYSQVNSNKILNIINGITEEIIFLKHKKMSFTLKPKDLKQLSKTVVFL